MKLRKLCPSSPFMTYTPPTHWSRFDVIAIWKQHEIPTGRHSDYLLFGFCFYFFGTKVRLSIRLVIGVAVLF